MFAVSWDRDAATILSPALGGIAPAFWLWMRNGAGGNLLAIGGPCIWALQDLLISYAVALPVLLLCRRHRVTQPVALWFVAAVIGAPIGYMLANPLVFAWTPEEADFISGPHWSHMAGYMALFGLSGLAYALGAERRRSSQA